AHGHADLRGPASSRGTHTRGSRLPPATRLSPIPAPCGSPSASLWSSASRSLLRERRILAALGSFRLLTQSRDSKSSGQVLFHVFRRPVQNQPRRNLVLPCPRRA